MKLGNLISLSGGGTPSKKNERYWDGDVPWASVKDFKTDLITNTKDSISLEGVNNSATRIVPAGTLLVITRLASGKAAFTGVDMAFNQDIKAIQCSDSLDKNYLFYFFKSRTNYFEKVASGATVKGIKIGHINNMEIPLPPLETQKRIAQILDDAAALRNKTQKLLEEYDLLAQSIFLEMFGDVVNNKKNWETKTIEELVVKSKGSIKRGPFGGALKKEIFVNEGYLVYEQYHALNNDFSFVF